MISIDIVIKFLLIFFRITGVISLCPLFGDRAFPTTARIALGIFFALLLYPTISPPAVSMNFSSIILAIAKETMIGITIGLAVLLIFIGTQLAGEVMGYQMGMWLAEIYEPQFGQETPIIGHFIYLFAIMLFVVTNAHLFVLKGLRESFSILPLAEFHFSSALHSEFIRLGSNVFKLGFQIGAPIIGVLLLVTLAMGIIARIIPEMNVFFVAIPLQIAVGFIFLGLAIPYIGGLLIQNYKNLGYEIMKIIKFITP